MVNDFGESNCKFQLFQAFTGLFASDFLSCFLDKDFLYCACEKTICFVTSIIAQIPEKWEGFYIIFLLVKADIR